MVDEAQDRCLRGVKELVTMSAACVERVQAHPTRDAHNRKDDFATGVQVVAERGSRRGSTVMHRERQWLHLHTCVR